jgi:hypothetical protein
MQHFKTKTMKNKTIRYINWSVVVFCALISIAGCTKKFDSFNTNPSLLTDAQSLKLVPTAIGPIETAMFSNYQVSQNLSADAYAGYMMSPDNFQGGLNNLKYDFVDTWNSPGFNDKYTQVMGPIKAIADAGARTSLPDIWGVALILQVEIMDKVTDKFGPIPYTKTGTSFRSIPYDDQKTVYESFFKQLDTAVNNIRTFLTSNAPQKNRMGNSDLIYSGDLNKWIKFANSLRLRLAMHLAKIDPATAKTQGEIALNAPEGVLAVNADNALLKQAGGRQNDYYLITLTYQRDNMFNASFGTYLNGYNDPRAPQMALPATQAGIAGSYAGIRLGADVTVADYRSFAAYNYVNTFTQFAPQMIMNASEMWFLKAEAALRGWSGSGDTKTNYETGIQTSMDQWGVSIGGYLNDATSKQANYTDPINPSNSTPAISSITIKWDESATQEQKLERIITQKWLAIFPDGQEAWADYRRTGYPKLFPVVQNLSNGTISSSIQVRRLTYPLSEGLSNPDGLKTGLTELGGPDNGGTRLWWDTGGANF